MLISKLPNMWGFILRLSAKAELKIIKAKKLKIKAILNNAHFIFLKVVVFIYKMNFMVFLMNHKDYNVYKQYYKRGSVTKTSTNYS